MKNEIDVEGVCAYTFSGGGTVWCTGVVRGVHMCSCNFNTTVTVTVNSV